MILDWSSLLHRQLRLGLLAIDEPVLHIRRDVERRFVVAGLAVSAEPVGRYRSRRLGARPEAHPHQWGHPGLGGRTARCAAAGPGGRQSCARQRRSPPPLRPLAALPPSALAARIDIRGDLVGDDVARWMDGKVNCSPNSTTSIWRAGSSGRLSDRPAARPWCDARLAGHCRGRLLDLTTDVALEDVRLQLARNLPELRLSPFHGRLVAFAQRRVFASARDLGFALEDGVRVPPTDFSVDWQASGDGKSVQGSGTASRMDLQRLTMLSRYLPLDAATRKRLTTMRRR